MALTAEEHKKASQWERRLRFEYRNGMMSSERIALIQVVLGPDWLGQPAERQQKSTEDWVPVAEGIACETGGTLPSLWELEKNGHDALADAMRRRPELFAHIPRAIGKKEGKNRGKKGRPPEEWVPVAEELARENGGMLPHGKWLQKNKYQALYRAVHFYPELFAHIPQQKKERGNSPEEWVPVAEELAKQNSGVLQSAFWLRKNYKGLSMAMYKRPELFAHIPQEARVERGPTRVR